MNGYEWDGTYSNGAYDGSPCDVCGGETEEPWQALCSDCYAEEQGWNSKPADEKLEQELDQIDAVSPLTEECPGCGETRVLFPSPEGRGCINCRGAGR